MALADKSINDVKAAFSLPASQPFILAVFHPVVQQAQDVYTQTSSVLLALKKAGLPVIWLEPNSDAGSSDILRALSDIGLPAGSSQLQHIKRDMFCAAMKHCAIMVGNSSAGIIEAASFSTPVINVGSRQHLRERSANVVDVNTDVDAIYSAILGALEAGKVECKNSYGDALAGQRIAGLLTTLSIDIDVLHKSNSY